MSYGDPDPAREGEQHTDGSPTEDPHTGDPEQDAVEETEETGEVNPSGAFPEGDEDTRTPV